MITGRGGGFLPIWFLSISPPNVDLFIIFIATITREFPLIALLRKFLRFLTCLITPQRVSWQNNSLTTVVEAVSSDVLKLRVPPKEISQQMSPFGQFKPCVNFAFVL